MYSKCEKVWGNRNDYGNRILTLNNAIFYVRLTRFIKYVISCTILSSIYNSLS